MYLLYSLALALALILSSPYWLYRMLRQGKYRAGLAERLGNVPQRLRQKPGSIWVHAVSVGEVLATSRLVEELRRRHPQTQVVVSTTTATGQALARERFGEDSVFYFPLDFGFAILPYLRALRPEMIVLAETELWPNLLRLAKLAGARIAVVNARISDRSFPGYRRLRALVSGALSRVDVFAAQTEEDRRRLVELGAPPHRVQVGGNLKFDVRPPPAVPLVDELRQAIASGGGGPVLVCGSTVEGEEGILLQAFVEVLRQHPRAVMVLAPRHPERFMTVSALLSASRLAFWQRSQWAEKAALEGGVFLLDSIGELAAVYALADLAFVGGSLAPRGGHNVLEPAQHGVPVLVGPYTENFREMVEIFVKGGAVKVVTRDTLGRELLNALADPAQQERMGRLAGELVQQYSGATARTLAMLEKLMAGEAAQ